MSEQIPALFEATYEKIHAIAVSKMRSERHSHTLTPTALLNESFLRLYGFEDDLDQESFIRLCARVMRNCLIDHSRYKNAQSRKGVKSDQTIHSVGDRLAEQGIELGSKMDEFLHWLDTQDEETQTIFNLRAFGNYSSQQISVLVDVSVPTVNRRLALLYSLVRKHIDSNVE